MVSFAFETAGPDDGDECSPAPDLMDMINGGTRTVSPVVPLPAIAPGTIPIFGPIDQEEHESDIEQDPDDDEESEDEEDDSDDQDDDEDTEFVRSQFTNCALMRQRIEEELKEIKQQEKLLLKKLQRLMNRDFEEETKLPEKPAEAKTEESQPSLPFAETPIAGSMASAHDWEKISAETVLSHIPKLSAKKKEALLDVFQNLKQMEDMRGDASRQFKHFAELLPEGIGKVLADQLEEAMYVAMK